MRVGDCGREGRAARAQAVSDGFSDGFGDGLIGRWSVAQADNLYKNETGVLHGGNYDIKKNGAGRKIAKMLTDKLRGDSMLYAVIVEALRGRRKHLDIPRRIICKLKSE